MGGGVLSPAAAVGCSAEGVAEGVLGAVAEAAGEAGADAAATVGARMGAAAGAGVVGRVGFEVPVACLFVQAELVS